MCVLCTHYGYYGSYMAEENSIVSRNQFWHNLLELTFIKEKKKPSNVCHSSLSVIVVLEEKYTPDFIPTYGLFLGLLQSNLTFNDIIKDIFGNVETHICKYIHLSLLTPYSDDGEGVEKSTHAQGQREGKYGGLVTESSVWRKLTPEPTVEENNTQKQADSCCRPLGSLKNCGTRHLWRWEWGWCWK